MTLPERMSEIMTEKKISKAELAKKLNISYSTIQSWIKRNSDPGSIYVEPIAKALNVSINYLITGTEVLPEQNPEDKQLLLNYYDQFKNDLFFTVKIPLIRIYAGTDYIKEINYAFDELKFPKTELQKPTNPPQNS